MSREVVLLRGSIVGAATALIHALVVAGVIPVGAETAVSGIVDAVGLVIALIAVRAGVTPVDAPKDAAGKELAPKS